MNLENSIVKKLILEREGKKGREKEKKGERERKREGTKGKG